MQGRDIAVRALPSAKIGHLFGQITGVLSCQMGDGVCGIGCVAGQAAVGLNQIPASVAYGCGAGGGPVGWPLSGADIDPGNDAYLRAKAGCNRWGVLDHDGVHD